MGLVKLMEENADLDHFSKEKVIITILKGNSYQHQNRKSVYVYMCVFVYPYRNKNGVFTLFLYNMKN